MLLWGFLWYEDGDFGYMSELWVDFDFVGFEEVVGVGLKLVDFFDDEFGWEGVVEFGGDDVFWCGGVGENIEWDKFDVFVERFEGFFVCVLVIDWVGVVFECGGEL